MDVQDDPRNRWNWVLAPCLVLVVLGGAGFALFWPQWRAEVRGSNERSAYSSLKALCSAQADYRANDRDLNGVSDFWTGDVAGLFQLGLIYRAIAEADAQPLKPLVARPIPYKGYYFIALRMDESETPAEELRQDTDKKSGKVHHRSKFAYCAYPARYGVTGRFTYIVNEGNTVRRRAGPSGPVDDWPSDEDQRHEWGIGD